MHSYSLKTFTNNFFETENLSIHFLVSNVQQSRMGAWLGFQQKDLEVCTTPVGNQLDANNVKVANFNCLISVIPNNTCCFLWLEKLHNDTHVSSTMAMNC
jgi:hypothetical protein